MTTPRSVSVKVAVRAGHGGDCERDLRRNRRATFARRRSHPRWFVRGCLLQNGLPGFPGDDSVLFGKAPDAGRHGRIRPLSGFCTRRWPASSPTAPSPRSRPWGRRSRRHCSQAPPASPPPLLGWRPAIAPIASSRCPASLRSTPRRRCWSAAGSWRPIGDCAVCHTAPEGGVKNAGGRPLDHAVRHASTARTSRPMRPPASAPGRSARFSARCAKASRATDIICTRRFHTPRYAKTSDDDLMALYAYLMSQPAVAGVETPANGPAAFRSISVRPLMAGLERAVP